MPGYVTTGDSYHKDSRYEGKYNLALIKKGSKLVQEVVPASGVQHSDLVKEDLLRETNDLHASNRMLKGESDKLREALQDCNEERNRLSMQGSFMGERNKKQHRTNTDLFQRLKDARSRVTALNKQLEEQEERERRIVDHNAILVAENERQRMENERQRMEIERQGMEIASYREVNADLRQKVASLTEDLDAIYQDWELSPCRCDCVNCSECVTKPT